MFIQAFAELQIQPGIVIMANHEPEFLPPTEPPPLLDPEQIKFFAIQGWLPIDIPRHLQSALKELSAAASNFFDLSFDEKRSTYPSSRGTECGFYHVPEEKEYLTFRHDVYANSVLEERVRFAWNQIAHLLLRILCDLSRAAFLSTSIWDSLVDGALNMPYNGSSLDVNTTLLRLFRYYPTNGYAEPHVDIGLLTLCVGEGKGLQVWDRLQSPPDWLDAEGPTLLIGAFLRKLLGNHVASGLHRVVGNPQGRTSTVFPLRPLMEGNLDLSKFGMEGIVETKDLFQRVKDSRYNINATKDVREQQRKARERGNQQQAQPHESDHVIEGHG